MVLGGELGTGAAGGQVGDGQAVDACIGVDIGRAGYLLAETRPVEDGPGCQAEDRGEISQLNVKAGVQVGLGRGVVAEGELVDVELGAGEGGVGSVSEGYLIR